MKLQVIEGNTIELDGGSMFGNTPKALWEKWIPADERNRIRLATRAMLLKTNDGRHILFEVGTGTFLEPKLADRYGISQNDSLLENLSMLGLRQEDIDLIILSHMHFDHVGGLLTPYQEGQPHQLRFPNAKYYVGKEQWERACRPHLRERSSFIPALHALLEESGRLRLIEGSGHPDLDFGVNFHYSHGHTLGLMLAELHLPEGPLVYVSDLIPGVPWIHLPTTMGYDRFPELLVDEKQQLLEKMAKENGRIFFAHDLTTPCVSIAKNENGKFVGTPVKI